MPPEDHPSMQPVPKNAPLVQPQATPFSYTLDRVPVGDGTFAVQLTLYLVTGNVVVLMTEENARGLARSLTQTATGLTIARPADLPEQNGHGSVRP